MTPVPRAAGTNRVLAEVAPGVHVATAGLYATTSTVVVGGDGSCLLVDPALTGAELDGLAAVIAARGWRPAAVVATHGHWDHLLVPDALRGLPHLGTGAAVAAAAAAWSGVVAEAERAAPGTGRYLAPARPVPPGGLPWAGTDVVVHEHHAHAPGHAALEVPAAGSLLVGDMLSDREVPLLDLGSPDPVGGYRAGLDLLAERLARVDVVVPGHGTPTTSAGARDRLEADRRYLAALSTGGDARDARLTDPWVRAEHERQRDAVRRG